MNSGIVQKKVFGQNELLFENCGSDLNMTEHKQFDFHQEDKITFYVFWLT